MALLIGVEHQEEFTSRVIRRLSHECLEDKKVMLEMSSYPIEEEIRKKCPSGTSFFEGIAAYVLDKRGILLFGEYPALYKRTIKKMEGIGCLVADLWDDYLQKRKEYDKNYSQYSRQEQQQKEEELYAEREQIAKKQRPLLRKHTLAQHAERDPHFAKVVMEQKPNIVILGAGHISYLIEHCFQDENYSFIRIPSDKLIRSLRRERH